MCLTGNFAISLMADDSVLASVASQPSLPQWPKKALHMSPEEVEQVKSKLDRVAINQEGHPTHEALKEVLAYFSKQLKN